MVRLMVHFLLLELVTVWAKLGRGSELRVPILGVPILGVPILGMPIGVFLGDLAEFPCLESHEKPGVAQAEGHP